MQNKVSQNSARDANNSAHPNCSTGRYTAEEFLTATKEPSAFRAIREEQPDFDLAKVDGATDEQILIWEMRVQLDGAEAQPDANNKSLDEIIAGKLEGQESKTPSAARAWLLDTTGAQYSPRKSVKVAREFVVQCEPAFEFSTDADLDGQLGSIEFLWSGRIPLGFVTGLVAEQDTGKSTVAQDFCRTHLIGGRWPDGQQCDTKADKILWIDTDGNLPLFHQRLKDWGMPRGHFIFPKDTLQELAIDNPENWRWIERTIEKFDIKLVVIDALSGSHNGKSNDEDSMKVIMKRLHALAQKHKIAVVVLHHLNKAPFGVASYPITIDRLRGSGAISQYCRSILALTTPDPARPEERRLDVIKLNIAKKPGPVGYTLTDYGPTWGEAPQPAQPRRAADNAADFLRDALANGKRPSSEIEEEAKESGISARALKEARGLLGVEAKRFGDAWTMQLPLKNDETKDFTPYP